VVGRHVVVEQQAPGHLVEEGMRPSDAPPALDRLDAHAVQGIVESRRLTGTREPPARWFHLMMRRALRAPAASSDEKRRGLET